MSMRIERIVRQADGQKPDVALSPQEAAQVEAHRALGSVLKQVYSFKPAEAPLAFMGERVLARARAVEPVGFAKSLQELWAALTARPVLAWSGASLVLAIVVAISFQFVHTPQKNTVSAPARLQSFIIYDTPDGNGFIQCFEYESVSKRSNANESS